MKFYQYCTFHGFVRVHRYINYVFNRIVVNFLQIPGPGDFYFIPLPIDLYQEEGNGEEKRNTSARLAQKPEKPFRVLKNGALKSFALPCNFLFSDLFAPTTK